MPDHSRRDPHRPGDRKVAQWKLWTLGVAVLILLIVVLQNAQRVEFNILFLSTDSPLIFLLLGAAIIGAVIGYTAPILRRHRHNTRREYRDR